MANPVHAYLFVGPAGVGKRAGARAFAAALLCPDGGDGTCRDCRLALSGEHPDVREVERMGAFISAPAADGDHPGGRTHAGGGGSQGARPRRVPPAAAAEAAARLLKTVEEPGPSTVFVILADDVPPDLVTIASRCVRIDFVPLADTVVEDVLLAEGVPAEAACQAAAAAGGNLDRARVLAIDTGLLGRRDAFHRLGHRLDGSGADGGPRRSTSCSG